MCWGLLLSQQCCTVGTEPLPGADAVFSGVSPVFPLCSHFLGKSLLLVKPLEVVAWQDALRYNPDTKAIVGLFPIDSSAAQRSVGVRGAAVTLPSSGSRALSLQGS